jgi:hypothetical protein
MNMARTIMLNERRSRPRNGFNRFARIQAEASGPTRDCLIVNISEESVRLHSDIADTLGDFTLMLSDGRPRRSCRVKWRIGFEIGATFTDVQRAPLRASAA